MYYFVQLYSQLYCGLAFTPTEAIKLIQSKRKDKDVSVQSIFLPGVWVYNGLSNLEKACFLDHVVISQLKFLLTAVLCGLMAIKM